jgi:hypothetical protein
MRRILLLSSLLVGLVAFGSKPANAAISLDIHVGDPAPVSYFYQQPRGYLVPDYNVWYYQNSDYDMYRYGNAWYMNDGGYWYSAPSWRGPFMGVRYASVPTQIVRIPSHFHRQTQGYWQAPRQQTYSQNQWNQQNRNETRYRNDDRSRNSGKGQWSQNNNENHGKSKNKGNNGRGNGKGHDKDRDND